MAETPSTNIPELTVSELAGALKRTIEESFGVVRLRGEISNYRGPHSSGHAYFCLKDQTARIDAVIWKHTLARMKTKPADGLDVIASGKVTTFPGKSAYQIVIDSLEPAGAGALMALLDERRRALAAEGLFSEARKQLLPFLPVTIGVVTSPTGAVIRDILHRIYERFPRHVLIWPVRVQGETCAAEVAAAIEGFNALPQHGSPCRPDIIIVARGGGSLEDLWGFNEEVVVRAAAASGIPLIAAVGHETDWTLIDHAADLRCPTPTGAAEKAVPVRSELLAAIGDLGRRHAFAASRLVAQRRADCRALVRALPPGHEIIAGRRQRLDASSVQFLNVLATAFDRRHIALVRFANRLAGQSPQARMARVAQRLDGLHHRLQSCLDVGTDRRRQRLAHAGLRLDAALVGRGRIEAERVAACRQRLEGLGSRMRYIVASSLARRQSMLAARTQLLASLGYRQVLARGFVLVRDGAGAPLRLAAAVEAGARLDLEFVDGHRGAVAHGAPGKSAAPQRSASIPTRKTSVQGSLF